MGVLSRGTLLRYLIHWENLCTADSGVPSPAVHTVVVDRHKEQLAQTAGTLGIELAVLRETIPLHASNTDVQLIDLVSRIEELVGELLTPRDLYAPYQDRWSGWQQPWSV